VILDDGPKEHAFHKYEELGNAVYHADFGVFVMFGELGFGVYVHDVLVNEVAKTRDRALYVVNFDAGANEDLIGEVAK
jgi:hypothetical protein